MSIAVLDINDANLQLWHGDKHVQSPGYALLVGTEYRFGAAARAAARLRPRDVSTRYWGQLNTQPLQPALGPARHSADLVHAHLLDLHKAAGEPAEVLLAVPGNLEREQLSLLLGIIEQCPFSAVGLVNRSVALAQPEAGNGRLFHLEFQLHQALLSEFEDNGGERRLLSSQPLPGCGMLPLQERLVEIIANHFIRHTRFDPRRKAGTEQDLYDALPSALIALRQRGEASLSIAGYSTRIQAAALLEAGQRLFSRVKELTRGSTPRLLADPLAGLLPGAESELPGLHILEPDRLPRVTSEQQPHIVHRDQPLSLVTTLPCAEASPEPPAPEPTPVNLNAAPSPTVAPAEGPSHLLQGFSARPLQAAGTLLAEGCELYYENAQWQLRGTGATVNGLPYHPGRPLHCGDTLAVAGQLVGVLIEVVDP
ncbi:hypothetical protein FV139_20300 [Parahaliea maris]|uniref:FHA domain-containing protein n=1 Tax=Parahaliea maris TaxID=2716870 RepID=A0A5C8ZPH7_9GAMM|nr:hypothetical protein [Parahaliea maris]TXS89281.1 hypothetical protein FV139_20300 [Parahaliea maris]